MKHNTVILKVIWLIPWLWLSACTAPVAPGSVRPLVSGQERDYFFVDSHQLFAEITGGWRIFEVEYKGRSGCMAVKPAKGMPWPKITEAYMVSGGAGFNMYLLDDLDVPYFGFYGEYPFGSSIATINNEIIQYSNDRETVLGWENLDATFTVTAQPRSTEGLMTPLLQRKTAIAGIASQLPPSSITFSNREGHKTSGEINFAGVTKAYEAMMQCHSS